jgi:transcriptional regulator GlxA family with amidase domain
MVGTILLGSVLLGSVAVALAQPPGGESKAAKPTVAFVISERFNEIDFAGPWEVFKAASLPKPDTPWADTPRIFAVYTVSDSTRPIRSGGGVMVVPSYTFDNAPKPDIVVIGAQSGRSPALFEWLRARHAEGATLLSVCVGAQKLAEAGLLDGLEATTHHEFLEDFRNEYPKTKWLPSKRYVRAAEGIYTAGGLTSGIDAALHLVAERYGEKAAQGTADYMEYEGKGWK